MVASSFDQLRGTHLRGHQDPIYAEFESIEEANEAWDEYQRQQLRDPPPLAPQHPQHDTSSASVRELVDSIAQPIGRSLALMTFEAPVMGAEERLEVEGEGIMTATNPAYRRRDPTDKQQRRDPAWAVYRRIREATSQARASSAEATQLSTETTAEPSEGGAQITVDVDQRAGFDTQLMGASVGWIALLLMLIPRPRLSISLHRFLTPGQWTPKNCLLRCLSNNHVSRRFSCAAPLLPVVSPAAVARLSVKQITCVTPSNLRGIASMIATAPMSSPAGIEISFFCSLPRVSALHRLAMYDISGLSSSCTRERLNPPNPAPSSLAASVKT